MLKEYLLHKSEGMSSNPQHLCRELGVAICICNPNTGAECGWPAHETASPSIARGPVSGSEVCVSVYAHTDRHKKKINKIKTKGF